MEVWRTGDKHNGIISKGTIVPMKVTVGGDYADFYGVLLAFRKRECF